MLGCRGVWYGVLLPRLSFLSAPSVCLYVCLYVCVNVWWLCGSGGGFPLLFLCTLSLSSSSSLSLPPSLPLAAPLSLSLVPPLSLSTYLPVCVYMYLSNMCRWTEIWCLSSFLRPPSVRVFACNTHCVQHALCLTQCVLHAYSSTHLSSVIRIVFDTHCVWYALCLIRIVFDTHCVW